MTKRRNGSFSDMMSEYPVQMKLFQALGVTAGKEVMWRIVDGIKPILAEPEWHYLRVLDTNSGLPSVQRAKQAIPNSNIRAGDLFVRFLVDEKVVATTRYNAKADEVVRLKDEFKTSRDVELYPASVERFAKLSARHKDTRQPISPHLGQPLPPQIAVTMPKDGMLVGYFLPEDIAGAVADGYYDD